MPTVLRKYGFRFHFYSGDGHEPPHIHVDGADGEAKVWLANVELAQSKGFNQRDIARIIETVQEHRAQRADGGGVA
ncbi:DUF4160 domain-containing protein [Agrobacterium sp. rho-8.1]|nr:DUF4160 domain-containing protein [Agrobacterium sp. rho-8.1]